MAWASVKRGGIGHFDADGCGTALMHFPLATCIDL
jgi:hypothetical protein